MAEEKKRGRGRPPKEKPAEHEGWGGKRPGAGRKKGFKLVENPKNTMLPFRVSAITAQRIKRLRDLTKADEKPFVDMFEKWVEVYAKEYGIE